MKHQTDKLVAAIRQNQGLTTEQLLETLDFVPTNLVGNLRNMAFRNKIVNSAPKGKPGVWWTPDAAPISAPKSPKLTSPKSGPGYTPNKWAAGQMFHAPASTPVRNSTTTGSYAQGMWEVARPEGLAHTLCHSRDGDRFIPYTGRTVALAGVLKDKQALGR